MKIVTIQEFEELVEEKESDSIQIIDVRGKEAFQLAHIERANNIPLDELQEKIKGLDKEQEYYIICYSGNFSRSGAEYLLHNGFKVVNVQSGMNAYKGTTVSSIDY